MTTDEILNKLEEKNWSYTLLKFEVLSNWPPFQQTRADKTKTINDKYVKLYKINCQSVKVNSEEASNHHLLYFLLMYCPKLTIKSKNQVLGYFLTIFTPWIELKVSYRGETL